MKFSTREDIDAPIDAVWDAVTNVRDFERRAIRKGSDVRATSEGEIGLGSGWTATFDYRGIQQELELVVTGFEAPQLLEVDSNVSGMDGTLTVELVALSQGATRLMLSIELRPATLNGRLLYQTLKFGKGPLSKLFTTSVHRFAKGLVPVT